MLKLISLLVLDFQWSVWEWSVHICSCPWVDLPSTIYFMYILRNTYYVQQTFFRMSYISQKPVCISICLCMFFFFQLTHFSVFLGPFFLYVAVLCRIMVLQTLNQGKKRKDDTYIMRLYLIKYTRSLARAFF